MSINRERLRYMDGLREALECAMNEDESTLIVGEDIRGSLRGETRGLLGKFGPERVLDTPVSEAAFVGFGTGAALEGLRPIIEFQVASLVYVAFDQLANQAAKYSFMLGGQANVPVTYLIMASGSAQANAGQHSDNPYPLLAHIGLKVVCPSTPADAKGLLLTAIRDPDPVVVVAPARCLGLRGPIPAGEHIVPLGVGVTHREGRDVTIIATGAMVGTCLTAADRVWTEHGISCTVWDPRSILPLDVDGLFAAVRQTGRVVVVDDSNRHCGFGAELAAQIAEHCWDQLQGPIMRMSRPTMPIAFSPVLEEACLLQVDDVVASVLRAMRSHNQTDSR